MPPRVRNRLLLVVLLVVAGCLAYMKHRHIGPVPVGRGAESDAPSALSQWPWANAGRDEPHRGVSHWRTRTGDGTALDLLRFDFSVNPELRLELYDQDEDDATPFDNQVDFWSRGVGQVTRHLNRNGRGRVIAAWNGLFFSNEPGERDRRWARHVAPVVLNGKAHYNVGNHRWTFGVQYRDGKPAFKTLHLPDKGTLEREFAFGAGGAQCLIREGAPLQLQPPPRPGDKPLPRPVPSTPREAGHIPDVDHIRTSRTSMGWSRDQQQFYLLIVKEPDSEVGSALALRGRIPVVGGWTVADLQRFWLSMRVWGAVNIDGGDVTQTVYLREDGGYEMVPPRWATPEPRLTFSPEFRKAPGGGTLMYFYVREAPG
ncbi:MAG: hypothetical protein COZ06_02975 [Armatimonadetes bacterium CG_4_10_14_3_um_filter_66_18]|nr:hypothetical protein [Armatimonadota bacterium]OIP00686.1 MAG: hypothetical protein AUJ96_18320 [Armatimonadetes bacterium CG2_30_66_41]PIU90839.1 MAG: hypothetical protein COS65_23930 [Armatimonadetes bacterium CG06_land_8_20_14_3_00_66_21]PIX40183.1 MAG: hypothetical protein COZ57_26615 [Armatimonadetes bacterium CG_4_8_14_3_um_filter_66_20]PIY52430.1 MAG: hypothetical protein COZ06_02975 [Armatimonadetes bacterium CG_4_10_14_3_um_filter_66_18]PIZ50336.1 MAG: hypothetical protein COY42_01